MIAEISTIMYNASIKYRNKNDPRSGLLLSGICIWLSGIIDMSTEQYEISLCLLYFHIIKNGKVSDFRLIKIKRI